MAVDLEDLEDLEVLRCVIIVIILMITITIETKKTTTELTYVYTYVYACQEGEIFFYAIQHTGISSVGVNKQLNCSTTTNKWRRCTSSADIVCL